MTHEEMKDYFSDKPRVRKFKVYFYKTAKNGTILVPPKTTVIFGRTRWVEEMDDAECPE